MKVFITLTCLLLSTIVSANILVVMKLNLKGKKSSISNEVRLDESQTLLLKDENLKVSYTLSNKKPVNFPKGHMWADDSVFLKAEILDLKTRKVIASPEVTTIYGEKAIIEMSDSEDMNKSFLKIEFTSKKL